MAKKADISRVENKVQKLPKSADIRNVPTIPTQLYRITTDLLVYRNSIIAAENLLIPQRYRWYQVANMAELDAHYTACKQQRKNLTLGRKFCVYTSAGVEDEELTKLIRKKWFRDFLDLSLESIFWGHSLIQFDSIININGTDEFKSVDLVPRIFVKPEFHIVTQDYAAFVGTDYLEPPYSQWVIGVGKPRDLGLLMKIAPLAIWKKNALGAWAEFVEKFGTPARIGKTDIRDEITRQNMQSMLQNMSVSLYAVLDTEDQIEYIETKTQDAFNVFKEMINTCNSEMSKLILGQTGTTDEKAFVGSAEVHERILDGYADLDAEWIDGVLNYQLVPLMNGLGFGLEGCYIAAEAEDELTLIEKGKFDIELLKTGKFTMTPEYLKEKYGTEVIPVDEPQVANVETVKNMLDELYK